MAAGLAPQPIAPSPAAAATSRSRSASLVPGTAVAGVGRASLDTSRDVHGEEQQADVARTEMSSCADRRPAGSLRNRTKGRHPARLYNPCASDPAATGARAIRVESPHE